MPFEVGQIVELHNDRRLKDYYPVAFGDCGTVTEMFTDALGRQVCVRWHPHDFESVKDEAHIRPVSRQIGSFAMYQALSVVLENQHPTAILELQRELERVTLDLEKARMASDEWRELANERDVRTLKGRRKLEFYEMDFQLALRTVTRTDEVAAEIARLQNQRPESDRYH